MLKSPRATQTSKGRRTTTDRPRPGPKMAKQDPNFIAAELAEHVHAAARSLAESYEAALKARLGFRARLGRLIEGTPHGSPKGNDRGEAACRAWMISSDPSQC